MNRLLKEAFDNEARVYDETTEYLLLDYDITLLTVTEQIMFNKDDEFILLDVGCGTGNLLSLLRKKFPKAHLYGLDFSLDMLEKAQEKKIDGVNYINMDLFEMETSSLPLLDVVVVSFVFHNFTALSEHKKALSAINNMLSVNGQLIIADLINPINSFSKRTIQGKLVERMRLHTLSNEEIKQWLGILAIEDNPLTIEKNVSLLRETGFEKIKTKALPNGANAVFSALKATTAINIKSELLYYGIQPDECTMDLYEAQNPFDIEKTGNNGIFISIDGLDVLVSLKHRVNAISPYKLWKKGADYYYITKFGRFVDAKIKPVVFPDWVFAPFEVNGETTNLSDFFVYEGEGFVHLGYNACSFNDNQKCLFCSVKRRDAIADRTEKDICLALDAILPRMPDNIHFCLGGGAYFPLSENVAFFKKIISTIRSHGKPNPIWVEMIPPSLQGIQELIDAGATSFGFNIEVWDEEKRTFHCPGKSQFTIDYYLTACQFVVQQLGRNSVGSCIIVGLDSFASIKEAIDNLLSKEILPCILLLKDFDTDLNGFIVPPQALRDYIRLSNYVAEEATKKQMTFDNFEGCLKCNCCTIMHDIQLMARR